MGATPSYVWFNGPPKWFIAPWAADAAVAPPGDTVEYGTAWGGTWVAGGRTQGDLQATPSFENRKLETDQDDAPVTGWRIANGLELMVPTLDVTLTMMNRALGGTLTEGASEDELGIGGGGNPFLSFFSLGFEGLAPGSTAASGSGAKYRRLYVPKVAASEVAELAFKGKEETVMGITFEAYIDDAQAAGERLYRWLDDQD